MSAVHLAEFDNHPLPPVRLAYRTEAFLWRLPLPQETATLTRKIPAPYHEAAGATWRAEGAEQYQYLGSMPDLHSSEVTAISVREPLLATGLANGRIFLWR